jgi:protein-tyrosine phosphatase
MPFIDTHNHIIPYVDDGAEDWETSLKMLRDAEADGITEVVATPHVLSEVELAEEEKFIGRFEELKLRAADAKINLKLHLGAELFIQPKFDFHCRMATLAQNGRYFLVEFPMSNIPQVIEERFPDIYPKDVTAIIAHPERNGSIVMRPEKAAKFVEKGALLQVTAGSLLGVFGNQVRAVAEQLMNSNLVHIIATDAHDTVRRTLKLREAYELVRDKWGQERADLLFYTNPKKIIHGEPVDIGEPLTLTNYAYIAPSSFANKVKAIFRR